MEICCCFYRLRDRLFQVRSRGVQCTYMVVVSFPLPTTWRWMASDFGRVKRLISSWKRLQSVCARGFSLTYFQVTCLIWNVDGWVRIFLVSLTRFLRRLHLNTMMRSNYSNQIIPEHICILCMLSKCLKTSAVLKKKASSS